MAKYRNKKTGVILDTKCKISGGDWEEVKGRKNKKDTTEESVDAGTENGDTDDDESGAGDGADDE